MSQPLVVRLLVAIGVASAGTAGFGTHAREHVDLAAPHVAQTCLSAWTPAAPRSTLATGGTNGSAMIALRLDARGTVTSAAVVVGSGSAAADRAALRTARTLEFFPETADCRPVPGSYVAEVASESAPALVASAPRSASRSITRARSAR